MRKFVLSASKKGRFWATYFKRSYVSSFPIFWWNRAHKHKKVNKWLPCYTIRLFSERNSSTSIENRNMTPAPAPETMTESFIRFKQKNSRSIKKENYNENSSSSYHWPIGWFLFQVIWKKILEPYHTYLKLTAAVQLAVVWLLLALRVVRVVIIFKTIPCKN